MYLIDKTLPHRKVHQYIVKFNSNTGLLQSRAVSVQHLYPHLQLFLNYANYLASIVMLLISVICSYHDILLRVYKCSLNCRHIPFRSHMLNIKSKNIHASLLVYIAYIRKQGTTCHMVWFCSASQVHIADKLIQFTITKFFVAL